MALTVEAICNLALLRIGQREPLIDSLTADETTEAAIAKVIWEPTRDAALEEFAWPFATRRSSLALSVVEHEAWDYVYALPSDCVAVRSIWGGQRVIGADQRVPFAIEHDVTSGKSVLLTDQDEVSLVYTARITNVALYSASFVQALAWKLAAEFALAIPEKSRLAAGLEQKYLMEIRKAAASALNQQQEDAPADSELIRYQGGG